MDAEARSDRALAWVDSKGVESMNYGLYLSASGVLTNLYRQDVFANNLANVETVGFKPDVATTRHRKAEAFEDRLGFDVSQKLLDRLGGGVLAGPQRIDFTPGALRRGNEHDVALEDKHHFFAVAVTDPTSGEQAVRLTRDGRFSVNAEGELVLPSGHKVLDDADQPIIIDRNAPFSINGAGRILQNGAEVARLQVTHVEQLDQLTKAGQNLFTYPDGSDLRTILENPTVKPGFIESSAADPIATLMKLVAATKAATGNANMLRYHDLLMDHAVNRLGRVA
jgi:flagellar basal-body rod protein FlgF